MNNFNLPNILTMTRVFGSLCIWPILVYESHTWIWVMWVALVYGFFCLTDFLDGHLARKWNQCTTLGECMDPIADKAIVMLTIAALLKSHDFSDVTVAAMMVVLFREILISGMREYLAKIGKAIPVIWASKVKTALQMVGLGLMVVGDALDVLLPPNPYNEVTVHWMGESLFILGSLLGAFTAFKYSKTFIAALARTETSR